MGSSDGRPEDSDLDCLSHRESEEWKKAETFRNAGIHGRAAKVFRAMWDQTGDPEAGWRYAHCLRLSGYIEVALSLLFELEKHHPEHLQIRDELIWGLYEGRLVPAKEKGDGAAVIQAARDMVSAEAEGKALRLAVFAVMGQAKTRGHWKLVSSWCDLLEPESLDTTARQAGHGSIPSDRERWYFGKLKALVQLEEWHLAAEVAQRACLDFPRNDNFVRWKANSLAGLGQLRAAVELLETLRPNIAWYALADISRYCFELEDVEGAWEIGQQAARAVGQDSAKVNLWDLLARVTLALDMPAAALPHAGLMESVRRENGWPLRPSHLEMLDRVCAHNGLERIPERSVREWKSMCREHWGLPPTTSLPQPSAAPPGERLPGQVVGWVPERSFAFILPRGKGEQVFVLAQDLPEEVRRNGARVTYEAIRHFDKRKNKESLRAVRVEPLRKGD